MSIFTNSVDARWLRWFLLGVTIIGSSLGAQQPRRTPGEIAEMVDATLLAVLPAERKLTQFTVAERGVRFDFDKTMSAFGYAVDDSTARSRLKLRHAVAQGSGALLSDCDQMGTKPCKLLGRAIYASVSPISVTDSDAVVWLSVRWIGSSSPRASFLSGFSTKVYLSRSNSGRWNYVRTGDGLIL